MSHMYILQVTSLATGDEHSLTNSGAMDVAHLSEMDVDKILAGAGPGNGLHNDHLDNGMLGHDLPDMLGGSGDDWASKGGGEVSSAARDSMVSLGGTGAGHPAMLPLLPHFGAHDDEEPIAQLPMHTVHGEMDASMGEFSRLMASDPTDMNAEPCASTLVHPGLLEQALDKHIQDFLVALQVPHPSQVLQQAALPGWPALTSLTGLFPVCYLGVNV